jgi:spermidine synthase
VTVERWATARVPGGPEMELWRRGADWSIRVGGLELMHSRQHASEDALADLALDALGEAQAPRRVLVGGLGMGFTVAAALRRLGAEDRVVVAELVPEVVAWCRGPLAAVAGDPLADPRVEARLGDVGDALRAGPWDAVMLDVDNGPEGLTRPANDALYAPRGLAAAWRALRPGGALTVWSVAPSPAFTRLLAAAGFEVREVGVRARPGGKGARHTVWVARRP